MPKEKKKGKSGIAASHVTRSQAVRKLQISLKDFRRLCILKGIYPRDPKKKKSGTDKTYYHVKDISFLAHEPLLDKFRSLKTFIKKYKKALAKKDPKRASYIKTNRPKFVLDHLIKERYPTFTDALNDLDDALTLTHLFAVLPKTSNGHTSLVGSRSYMLSREWQNFIFRTFSLRKVFVSIKGIYYQANVEGQDITWLVPHQFSQHMPSDVDYRVMITFVNFYHTLIKFVNFKLFHQIGLLYPPKLDAIKDALRVGIQVLDIQPLSAGASASDSASAPSASNPSAQATPSSNSALQSKVDSVVAALKNKQPQEIAEDGQNAAEAEAEAQDDARLEAITQNPETVKHRNLFAGLVFLISREVPQDSLEFVILCGGGSVLREDVIPSSEVENEKFTHQIVDRTSQKKHILSREYVQPQWVYDSFNAKTRLPTEPYSTGAVLPPHLSPFELQRKDKTVDYIPEQAQKLQEWGAEPGIFAPVEPSELPKKPLKEDVESDEDDAEAEQRFQADLEKERAGVSFSAGAKTEGEEDDEKEEVEDDDDDDEAALDEPSSDDEEDGTAVRAKEADGDEDDDEDEDEKDEGDDDDVAAYVDKKVIVPVHEGDEREMQKMMMSGKWRKKYEKIKAGEREKAAEVAKLTERAKGVKRPAEEMSGPVTKKAKKNGSKRKGVK